MLLVRVTVRHLAGVNCFGQGESAISMFGGKTGVRFAPLRNDLFRIDRVHTIISGAVKHHDRHASSSLARQALLHCFERGSPLYDRIRAALFHDGKSSGNARRRFEFRSGEDGNAGKEIRVGCPSDDGHCAPCGSARDVHAI